MLVSASVGYMEDEYWREHRQRVKDWICAQLDGEFPMWTFRAFILYVDGRPVLCQEGYWEIREDRIYIGENAARNNPSKQTMISVLIAMADLFGMIGDEQVAEKIEGAIARLLSGISDQLMKGIVRTTGTVTRMAINGTQMACEVDGKWRSPNGAEVDVTGTGWVAFAYRT